MTKEVIYGIALEKNRGAGKIAQKRKWKDGAAEKAREPNEQDVVQASVRRVRAARDILHGARADSLQIDKTRQHQIIHRAYDCDRGGKFVVDDVLAVELLQGFACLHEKFRLS